MKVTGPSRPLRALSGVIGGWIAFRVLVPLPEMLADARVRDADPENPVGAAGHDPMGIIVDATVAPTANRSAATLTVDRVIRPHSRAAPVRLALDLVRPEPPSGKIGLQNAKATDTALRQPRASEIAAGLPPLPHAARDRLSLSAWAIGRDGGRAALGTGSELGGSQAGARVFYEPGPRGAVLTARISAPLRSNSGAEISVGAGYRTRLGGVLLERRIALDGGGRNAFSLTAYGGVSDIALPAHVRLDAYAQAGVVGARSRDGFADGAARVERSVATIGPARIAVGAGAWGGIQPGASRIDVGPQLVAHVPVEDGNLRVSVEWRERVAGNARPGSGPVVAIGVDF